MTDVRAGKISTAKNFVFGEDLSSQADGLVTEFTIANAFDEGSVAVYMNGLRQQGGIGKDYVEGPGNIITFIIAPDVEDIILVDYVKI